MQKCPHQTCYAPDTSCALGELDYRKCRRWEGAKEVASGPQETKDHVLLPWTGAALGLSDLSFITGREKPLIVGIAGPESAGKTTLLASWYLLMGRGKLLKPDLRFGGSYTLGGWEAVASSLRWAPGQSPAFPPHTTSRDARAPGLLHFALREDATRPRDYLFADAPGAWFQKWAINAQDQEASGARWLARYADVLLLVADRQALSGAKIGQARNGFQLLAKRIAAERHGRPVALVWTKGDLDIRKDLEQTIRAAVFDEIDDASEFTTSVVSAPGDDCGKGLIPLFAWIQAQRRVLGGEIAIGSRITFDPLFLFGRR